MFGSNVLVTNQQQRTTASGTESISGIHSFAVRYYNSLGRAATIVFARGKLLIPTYVRDRLYSLEQGRRLGMVFLQIGEDTGVKRRNTLLLAEGAFSKCKNLIICETIAANYDYYPLRRSCERANKRIRPAMGCALYPR